MIFVALAVLGISLVTGAQVRSWFVPLAVKSARFVRSGPDGGVSAPDFCTRQAPGVAADAAEAPSPIKPPFVELQTAM